MQTDEIIQKLKGISSTKVDGFNEENVKHHVVTKILEILGYSDVLDLEHKAGTDRPDIIINTFELPIVIEVKGAAENQLSRHIPQIEGYSHSRNSRLSILTNGKCFYVFSPFWPRKSFAERLILSFTLEDLGNREISGRVVSLLNKAQGYKKMSEVISGMQNEIEDKENKINEVKSKINDLRNQEKLLQEKYPKIEEMRKLKEYLATEKKAELESYSSIKEQIRKYQEDIDTLKKQTPSLGPDESRIIIRPVIIPDIQSSSENFCRGTVDEVINIKALQLGTQIVLCRNDYACNNPIFLLPKTDWKSDFTPSVEGRKLMGGPIIRDRCKHVAEIKHLDIPGLSRDFWQQMYDTGEFNLWDIDRGPLMYFQRSKKNKMLFMILRVYEMPFEIQEGRDFKRQRRSPRLFNEQTLVRVQSEFENGKFTPVLGEDEFNKRKQSIEEIALQY